MGAAKPEGSRGGFGLRGRARSAVREKTKSRQPLARAARLGLVLLWVAAALSAASMAQTPAEEFLARNEDERAMTAEEMRGGLAALLEGAARARGAGERSEAARLMNRVGRLQLRLYSPRDALTAYHDARSILARAP